MTPLLDERGIVTGWLIRLLLGITVLGVALFDAGSIAANFFGLDSTANDVAIELSGDLADQPGATNCIASPALEESAKALAREDDARLVELSVRSEPVCLVQVTLRRRADTLIVGRISAIADWAVATADGQSGSS